MARTESKMLALGTQMPNFVLMDTRSHRIVRDEEIRGQHGIMVMFICNHCPFVKHIRDELAAIGAEFPKMGVDVVAISSNDIESHPADHPDQMTREAEEAGYTFPYLFDETQDVARAFYAACTPDFFLFDNERRLVYRGQLDESRPGNGKPISGTDLRGAVNALVAGEPQVSEQRPSVGCNIKWKS